MVSNHPRGIAFETGTTKPIGFYILTAEQIGVTSGILGATYGLYTDGKTDILSKSSTYGGTCYADAATLSLDRDGTLITLEPNAPGELGGSGTAFRMVYGCGGNVECVTATTTPASGQTSVSFNLSKRPDAFVIQLMDNVEFSQYHRVLRVVCDGTNIYGIEFENSLTFSDTAWSWSYDNGVLTVSSQSTSVGGYFHNPGTYKLTAFYGSKGVQVVEVNPLSVSENGTYEAPEGEAYNPVSVNIPIPKNTQGYHGIGSVTTTSYSKTNVKVTVSKTGIYKVSWFGLKSSTASGTFGSQLYIDNTAYGSAQTTFDQASRLQSVILTNVSLTAGQTVEVRARASSTSYSTTVGNLIIEEQ